MNQIYSARTYWSLIFFSIVSPIVLFGTMLLISPFFLLIYFIPIGLVLLALLAIIAVSLQNSKDVRFGYLIFIHLAIEIYLWIFWLLQTLDLIVKKTYNEEIGLSILILVIGLVLIFPRLFVASTLFNFSSTRRLKSALGGVSLLLVVGLGFGFYNTTLATQSPFWKTLTNTACGYEIKYSPRLTSGGGSFGGAPCGYWNFERGNDHLNSLKIDRVGNLEYRGTGVGQETTISGDKIERVSQNNQSFSVRITNDKKTADINCYFQDTEMLEICNEMITTFRFIQ